MAACENMPDAVKLTAKDLLRDGLGENPLFYCLIAEVHNHQKLSGKVTVGFAMYYFTYDPWIGKLLYLEDFYVIQAYQESHQKPLLLHALSCHLEPGFY